MTIPNPHPLVGVIGKKRHGKDTFASPLVDELGFSRVAFADPLKEAALRLDPKIAEEVWPDGIEGGPRYDVRLSDLVAEVGWERAKDVHPEVRGILQRLGTDAIRTLEPDFWIRQALLAIDTRTTGVVVTDVRFPNEADAIRERGGLLVRVFRPGYEADGDDHPTERALDGYVVDVEVRNDDTLDSLKDKARALRAS